MDIQLIRHATLILTINNKRILVDPMLSKVGLLCPIKGVPNQNFNPLVELPIDVEDIINCDAVLLTHTHRDHFDDEAAKLLSKNMPILCQPEDEVKLKELGFLDVKPVANNYTWNDINFSRTDGKHGHGLIAVQMAPVSGFVISSYGNPTVYIAGDSVLCKEVRNSIEKYKPEIVVCNCGAAKFPLGKPITMDEKDIHDIISSYPNVKIVAVHMEAWNHCNLTRSALIEYANTNNIASHMYVPKDGEVLTF